MRLEYRLILSDINMPGMSDLDLLTKAKALRPDVPVIMITAYGDAETKRKAFSPSYFGGGMTALLTYDAACRAVAEAKTLDEVRDWEDKTAAVREYSRRVGNRQLELDAIEIRQRARRRRGGLLLALRAEGKLRRASGQKMKSSAEDIITLKQLGVSANELPQRSAISVLVPGLVPGVPGETGVSLD
jgi:CheY-like chemotaxis protein